MLCRAMLVALSLLLVASVSLAKSKRPTPDELLTASDAIYYYPQAQGLTDLAVDVAIDELEADSAFKDMRCTFYYAGDNRQRFALANAENLPTKAVSDLRAILDPLGEYVIPQPSRKTFTGLKLSVHRVSRQLSNVPVTTFYQITGMTVDAKAPVKAYRVLLDTRGMAYQMENVLRDGSTLSARLENTRMGEYCLINKVVTRLPSRGTYIWKIDTITYDTIAGYYLPTRITSEYRNEQNQPVKGLVNLTLHLSHYRTNSGEAAAALAEEKPVEPSSAPSVEATPVTP